MSRIEPPLCIECREYVATRGKYCELCFLRHERRIINAQKLFLAYMEKWLLSLPENYWTTNVRSDSDMCQDFGSFLVENKRSELSKR